MFMVIFRLYSEILVKVIENRFNNLSLLDIVLCSMFLVLFLKIVGWQLFLLVYLLSLP